MIVLSAKTMLILVLYFYAYFVMGGILCIYAQ